jgi:predicted PurR-regulated permease PerM
MSERIPPLPKKMVSRNVAMALGIICIMLIALIAYFSITGISAQNSYTNLQNQDKQLQAWLDGNETLLNQTETWLNGNITYYNSEISSLNSQIIFLQDQLNTSTNNVLLETNMGNITIQLFDDMPITTGNFENLVRTGVYDCQTSLALLQVL